MMQSACGGRRERLDLAMGLILDNFQDKPLFLRMIMFLLPSECFVSVVRETKIDRVDSLRPLAT